MESYSVTGNDKTDRLLEIARRFTTQEVNTYIAIYRPRFLSFTRQGKKVMLSDMKKKELDSLNDGELMYVFRFTTDTIKTTVVTPFNCSSVLREQGYSCEKVPHVEGVKVDYGNSREVGLDGKPQFENPGGYLKYIKGNEFFLAPVEESFINLNYSRLDNAIITPFNKQFAQITALLATFFGVKNGNVIFVDAQEAGANLLNLAKILGPPNSRPLTAYEIDDVLKNSLCLDAAGWDRANLHGIKFCHQFYYSFLDWAKKNPRNIGNKIDALLGVFKDKNGTKMWRVENHQLVLGIASFTLPASLNNTPLNIIGRKADISQAYYARHLSQSFRGVDKGEKGGLSRGAYLSVFLDPSIAELIYLVTNLDRMLDVRRDIILNVGDRRGLGLATQFFEALELLKFKGRLVIQADSSLLPKLKLKREGVVSEYSFGDAEYCVFLVADIKYYFKEHENTLVDLVDPVIFDLASSTASAFEKKNVEKYDRHFSNDYDQRVKSWLTYDYPVIARTSVFADIYKRNVKVSGKEKEVMEQRKEEGSNKESGQEGSSAQGKGKHEKSVRIISGAELHNLTAWVLVDYDYELNGNWWYELDNYDTMREYLSATILVNIVKSMRHVFRLSPSEVLRSLKFKFPVFYTSILAHVKGQVLWDEINVGAIESMTTEEALNAFVMASVPAKEKMMKIDKIRKIVMDPSLVLSPKTEQCVDDLNDVFSQFSVQLDDTEK